jgi:DNA (cytosine-5)-methyltransferase 1
MRRGPTNERVVELFAGGGGAARGLHLAGARAVGFVEENKHAVATLRAAMSEGLLNEAPVLAKRVENVDYSRRRGEATGLWSSFPCSGYSTAGAGLGMDDPRDGWAGTVRALDQVEPRWFIGENVDLLKRDPRAFAKIADDLQARFPYTESWVLDAADFGVPQHRLRRFFVGSQRPVQRPAKTGSWISMFDALEYDPWARLEPVYQGSWAQGGFRQSEIPELIEQGSTLEELIAGGPEGYYCLVCDDDAGYCACPGPLDSETTLSRPSPTLTGGSQSSHTSGRSLYASSRTREVVFAALGRHPGSGRGGLTVPEAALLQGFPPSWPFQGSKQARYRQIANAVPPALAQAVGQAVFG